MTLNSFQLIICFFALICILSIIQFFRTKKKDNKILAPIQLTILLLFSYYYVTYSSWKCFACVLLYTLVIYVVGRFAYNKKTVLLIGVSCSLIMLGYFKYTNFFLGDFSKLLGFDFVSLNIIMPLGISFYTFSGIAYLIDVYRGDYAAKRSFLEVALYISFFPKITAGPIVRGKDFFPQFEKYRGIELAAFLTGIQIFIFGLFKKMVLADHLGVFVDDVFYAPTAYNTGTVILAVLSYSLQIYFDFSGYSDMAIGLSKILGFDFKPNFNLPYIAVSMSDFWKRWHISLSSWFQDYVYIPLGGSRKGNGRTYLNLILVMAISGLWHGAGITFVAWGLLHGVASCVSRGITKHLKTNGAIVKLLCGSVTYITVALLWVLFRADSFSNALAVLKGMFTIHTGIAQPYTWSFFALACLGVATLTAFVGSKKTKDEYVNGLYPVMDLSKVIPLTIFFTFCGLTLLLGYYGNTAFIYGRF